MALSYSETSDLRTAKALLETRPCRSMGQGHFIVRRLERLHGREKIRQLYDALQLVSIRKLQEQSKGTGRGFHEASRADRL